jgi:hypothetical protein
VAEPGTITAGADQAARLVPTRFAGLQAAPAPVPDAPPGPFGRHLAGATAGEIVAAMRQVWPGCRDSERARARGARLLLEHLSTFPGGAWQQRWEASGLDDAGQPVNAMIPGLEGRKEICTGAADLAGGSQAPPPQHPIAIAPGRCRRRRQLREKYASRKPAGGHRAIRHSASVPVRCAPRQVKQDRPASGRLSCGAVDCSPRAHRSAVAMSIPLCDPRPDDGGVRRPVAASPNE